SQRLDRTGLSSNDLALVKTPPSPTRLRNAVDRGATVILGTAYYFRCPRESRGSLVQGARLGAAGRPVKQLDRVHHRARIGVELGDAADIAGGDDLGAGCGDIAELARAQPVGEFMLKHVVGAGRAAAEMALGNFAHVESG